MTLGNLATVVDRDQYIYIWFSDDIVGRGSIDRLLRRREINALLDSKVVKVYACNNELHIHTEYK